MQSAKGFLQGMVAMQQITESILPEATGVVREHFRPPPRLAVGQNYVPRHSPRPKR